MSAVPAKIVLKSTTKVTLSDRFTQIQKMRPPPPSPQEVRATMAVNQQSTQQNRRLAQQMASRPAVQAALGMPPPRQQKRPQNFQNYQNFQQKSLKQRLGPANVKARLSLGNSPMRGRSRGGRGGGFRGGRGGQQVMNGYMGRGDGRGMRSRGGFVNRGRGGFSPRWQDDRRPRGRGGFGYPADVQFRGGRGGRGNRGGGGGDRGFGRGQRGRGFGRGQRGGMMRGRGRGRGGNRQGGGVSKEQLDNQLEEYMSKTKSHLDTELDAYMAEADQ